MTSRYRCYALTNWAMKPLTLGAGHLWVLMGPWRMDVKWYMKCSIYWTADLKSSKPWSSQFWTQFKKFKFTLQFKNIPELNWFNIPRTLLSPSKSSLLVFVVSVTLLDRFARSKYVDKASDLFPFVYRIEFFDNVWIEQRRLWNVTCQAHSAPNWYYFIFK